MARRYRYVSRHALTGALIDADVRFRGASFSYDIAGPGSFGATVAVPAPSDDDDESALDRLRRAVSDGTGQHPQAAIYVQRVSDGAYLWGGPVLETRSDGRGAEVAVKAVSWKWWLYQVPLTPGITAMNATGRDLVWSWSNVEQLTIAREVVQAVLDQPDPAPIDNPVWPASSKTRTYSTFGSELRTAGEILDSIGGRAGGFEWDVIVGGDGTAPTITFTPFYPARGGHLPARFATGLNVVEFDGIASSTVDRASRVWTIGAGTAPDIAIATDVDPQLGTGHRLRQETSRSYSNTSNRTTLADYAARVRRRLAEDAGTVKLTTLLTGRTAPDPDSYGPGDRVAVAIGNRWSGIEVAGARILSKEIDTAGAGRVSVEIDLSDLVEPEEE